MSEINCNSCDALRENAPYFMLNGITGNECTSLKNNTGLSTTSGNDDCTDLDLMNDCLIGNLEKEIDAESTCGWKPFVKKYIGNSWNMFKGFVCAICGLWENIDKLNCIVEYMTQGYPFSIGEDETDGSYVVAGKGVSFIQAKGGSGHTSDISLVYIAGGLMRGTGSLEWHQSDFTEPNGAECWNFDNGSVIRKSNSRKGNPMWQYTGRLAGGGVLLYEIRINKSQYPQLGKIFAGFGIESNGGAYRVNVNVYDGDDTDPEEEPVKYAWGNYGHCNKKTGLSDGSYTVNGTSYTYDNGHEVPKGWVYIQVRLTYSDMVHNDTQYTPRYFMGVRMNADEIPCE